MKQQQAQQTHANVHAHTFAAVVFCFSGAGVSSFRFPNNDAYTCPSLRYVPSKQSKTLDRVIMNVVRGRKSQAMKMLLSAGPPAYGDETYRKLQATQFADDPNDPARLTDQEQQNGNIKRTSAHRQRATERGTAALGEHRPRATERRQH